MATASWTKLALLALKAGKVPLILGGPGIGKTKMIETVIHAALHEEAPFVVVSPALSDPTDAVGPLAVVHEKAVRLIPEVMKPLIAAGRGTLFIDEVTTATQATQAAFLRLTQDRVCGDTHLPDGVVVILAANPADIAAGGSELVAPLANRLVHIKADPPTVQAWNAFLMGELIATEEQRTTAALFTSFLAAKSNLLYALPEDEGKRAEAWPSPRSWHNAALCYAQAVHDGDKAAGLELIAGCVGAAAATSIVAYLKNMDLPNARELLTGRIAWDADPARLDITRAVMASVVTEALNGPAETLDERSRLVEAAWNVIEGAVEKGSASDAAYAVVKDLDNWRLRKSGAARARFDAEQRLRTGKLIKMFEAINSGG